MKKLQEALVASLRRKVGYRGRFEGGLMRDMTLSVNRLGYGPGSCGSEA